MKCSYLFCNMYESNIFIMRHPTCIEMENGVPQWFRIMNIQRGYTKSTVYLSPDGTEFDSIEKLKEWRENLVYMEDDPYY